MQQGGSDLQPVQEGSGEITAPAEVTSDDTTQASESDDSAPESARETVERVFNEAQKETSGEDSSAEAPPQEGVTVKREAKKPEQQKEQQTQPFRIPPPARLNANQKEIFNALPDPLKRATHAMFRDQEALLTRQNQQLQAEIRENQSMREAVRPYLLAHPELQQEGFTESRLVSALIAAHQKLTDPKTAKQTWLELGRQVGMDPEVLEAIRTHAGAVQPQQMDVSQHPQFVALQQELKQLRSEVEKPRQEQFEAQVSSIVSEMETVREEKDQFGRYLYPELHDEQFLLQAKPLVSALVGAIPGISYGDALKRAYQTIKGQAGNSAQVNQTRFPAQNEQIQRAQQAAVSVRGRSAPAAAGDASDIPPEALATPAASVKWALQQLRRGA